MMMKINKIYTKALWLTFVLFSFISIVAETNEQIEVKIKNSGKYLFRESYTTSEKQAKHEAYDALIDTINANKEKVDLKDIESSIQYLVINNGLGVQVVAYLPISVYVSAIKKLKRTNGQLKEDIKKLPDSCSLKVAEYSLENSVLRDLISKNGTLLLSRINKSLKKMIKEKVAVNRVNLDRISISKNAKKELNRLWEQHHFACMKPVLSGPLKKENGTYKYTSIPLYFGYEDEENRILKGTLVFNDKGMIDSFYVSFKKHKNNVEKENKTAGTETIRKVKKNLKLPSECTLNIAAYSLTDENLRNLINKNTTKLFSEINKKYIEQTKNVDSSIYPDFKGISIDVSTKKTIHRLWEMSPFAIRKEQLLGPVIVRFSEGYEYRPVPVFVKKADSSHQYDEAVIVYDKQGTITNFYYSIHKFKDIVGSNTSPAEYRKRQIILDFLENVRTAYNRKDIGLINEMYSDNALIIKGFVVKPTASDLNPNRFNKDKVILKRVTKEKYIESLKHIFSKNSFVNIKFDDIIVTKHDVAKDIYGVQLKQKWNSSNYADTGFLFMMIDFRESEKTTTAESLPPIIHVRVWQPLADSNGNELDIEQRYGLADCGFIE